MKDVSFLQKFCLLLITCACFSNCKKNNSRQNIILYNKPLPFIQSHIQGKWELLYGKGGTAANTVQYFNNFFWEFTKNNKITEYDNLTKILDTTLNWTYDLGTFTNADSTFIMKFYDPSGYPNV
jgi:hypothetical protein